MYRLPEIIDVPPCPECGRKYPPNCPKCDGQLEMRQVYQVMWDVDTQVNLRPATIDRMQMVGTFWFCPRCERNYQERGAAVIEYENLP